ncbi:Protein IRX15-LIKE [Acorus calamus]|uniref:Protein IRX15-LIKE n=1 Tax=Acorus calamus TaxID=4465 RepID=A0AAV9ET25_ACOCL|nr:Protein IRX15-LIKE [Acorus calamus]
MKTTTTTTPTPTTTNNNNTKLILFHHSFPTKQTPIGLYLLAFLSLSALAFLLTLHSSLTNPTTHPTTPPTPQTQPPHLARETSDALLYYHATSNRTDRMPSPDARAIARAISSCAPCPVLVFGLGHETPLWRALNPGGRTVFVDQNEYYVSHFEDRHPHLEAYGVHYATRESEAEELVRAAKAEARGACRPVQDLLFSECGLAINDMPNELYEVGWEVIVVDGPRGGDSSAPGRMAAIFTAGVLARSKKGGSEGTHVFVHDFDGEVERVCAEEFLCKENLVGSTGRLAHYIVRRAGDQGEGVGFCLGETKGDLQ